MADDKVSVNTERMEPAVDGFKSLGDRLVQITSKLEHTLDSLGTPWGDDKNGHAFFKQYGTARDQTLTGVTDMAGVVHSVGEGVRQMIDAYEKVEEHNQELARKMQLRREGNSDGGGGGGGSYGGDGGGGGDKKVPLERATRRELTRQRLAEPAITEKGEPLQPLQPLERREALEGIPAVHEQGEPLEPLRPALRGELKQAIPAMPARMLATSEDGVPLETERHELLPRTEERQADALIPAEKGKFVKSVPAEPAEFIPAKPGVLAESRFSAAIPAERGEFVPQTQGVPVTEARSFAAEPTTPMGHLIRREGEPLLPVDKGIPAEPLVRADGEVSLPRHHSMPLEPLHRADGVVTPPSHVNAPHLTSRLVAQPAPGEATLPRHEGVPAEPLRRADGVALTPMHRLEPVVHRGFAELEPESFIPAEPEK